MKIKNDRVKNFPCILSFKRVEICIIDGHKNEDIARDSVQLAKFLNTEIIGKNDNIEVLAFPEKCFGMTLAEQDVFKQLDELDPKSSVDEKL